MTLPFIELNTQYKRLENQIQQRIQTVLNHQQYIMGPEIEELESVLANFLGVKHAIALSSGTDALLIALMALGVTVGDEVITSPFSFFATVEVIVLLGARPVFVDISPKTYNMDPSLIERAITPKTKAILPVSLYGQCADVQTINAIAEKYQLPVIEDAAQSFGATHHGKHSGAITTIGCTSFFPSKPLGAYGDSGACFTNDDLLAEQMRSIRVHGQEGRYHHPIIGLCGRMDSLQAAILLEKMTIFPEEVALRKEIGERYTALLAPLVKTPYIEPFNTSTYAQYTIEVPERERLGSFLKTQGIPTAVHYPCPLHRQPAMAYLNLPCGRYPESERVSRHVISLPMHPYLERSQQDQIIEVIREALNKGDCHV